MIKETTNKFPFHTYYDARIRPFQTFRPEPVDGGLSGGWTWFLPRHITTEERTLSYQFFPHFHPYVTELVKRLVEKGVTGLQDADTEYQKKADGTQVMLPDGKSPRPTLYEDIFTQSSYNPSDVVQQPYPVKDLDFTSSGAYSVYNWELFYHIPLEVAIHLSQNQRFEEAQNWFHYIFDPTDNSDGPTPERFWKVKPFQYTDVQLIENVLINLSSGDDPKLQQETITSIEAWKDSPFRPFLVARYRQTAFMFKAVMAYLDNLIAWGDSLFQEDTGESINEATQIYVLAANILGKRPQQVPPKGTVRPQTYASLRNNLDAFGNALRDLETDIPFDFAPHPTDAAAMEQFSVLRSVGNTLYFCVPRNDNLLAYWDTVADRLFKIHNSLNFQGIFRQLPLFEPPIDPALLARAAAAGLDIGAVISGLNQPLPLVRFQLLVQKATEICQEVKSLGNELLSAIEKGDNEALAILRAKHERTILELNEAVKYQSWQESIKNREGLEKSLANAAQRYTYFEMQLGTQASAITAAIPTPDALDINSIESMNYNQNEPVVAQRQISVDIAQDLSGEGGGHKLNSQEVEELSKLKDASDNHATASTFDHIGAGLGLIPGFSARFQPLGVGGSISFGGSNLAASMSLTAGIYRANADQSSYDATKASKIASYARREMDWAYQSNLAAGEMTQLFKQLRAAQIREHVAEREWHNHQTQITQAKEIEQFLTDEKVGKETNQAFYLWMKRTVKNLYGQAFQFAFQTARKAERALQHELGDMSLSYLQSGYLAGKEGLLAGEQLFQDIKRMEMAYHDLNRREYELTKNISLLQLDPLALIELRTTGRCTFTLPEELFDMDGPGHYFRRIRTIAVSVPCVVGPYTGVNCTLTMQKSSIRTVSDGDYVRTGDDDNRFSDYSGSLQSIVTSTGQNDSGLFETNLHDERYLPFEGSGVISSWQLELPADIRQFDYETIADVILHVRYTAREGGGLLRNGAVANLKANIEQAKTVGSVRLFSVRHEFPTEWAKFRNVQIGGAVTVAELSLMLRAEHYPFWSQSIWSSGMPDTVQRVDIFAQTTHPVTLSDKADGTGKSDALVLDKAMNMQVGKLTNIALPAPVGKFTLYLSNNSMDDLWLAVTWGGK